MSGYMPGRKKKSNFSKQVLMQKVTKVCQPLRGNWEWSIEKWGCCQEHDSNGFTYCQWHVGGPKARGYNPWRTA